MDAVEKKTILVAMSGALPTVRLADGAHWNHGGQQICSEVLAEWLRSNVPMLRRRL